MGGPHPSACMSSHCVPVFWVALMSLEGKSSQDRSRIDPKRHRKNDEKKKASWRVLGGGFQGRAMAVVARPPPFLHFQRTKQTRTRAQTPVKTTLARHARKRGGRYPKLGRDGVQKDVKGLDGSFHYLLERSKVIQSGVHSYRSFKNQI